MHNEEINFSKEELGDESPEAIEDRFVEALRDKNFITYIKEEALGLLETQKKDPDSIDLIAEAVVAQIMNKLTEMGHEPIELDVRAILGLALLKLGEIDGDDEAKEQAKDLAEVVAGSMAEINAFDLRYRAINPDEVDKAFERLVA